MTVKQVSAKIDLRLNKAASGDYDNIWNYHKEEAFKKAINSWVRRQIHGKNQTQEGDEETVMRLDDLQVLLKNDTLSFKEKGIYVESEKLPSDYTNFKRLTPYCSANVDILSSLPSFKFEETLHTIIGNKIRVFHNKDFKIDKLVLTYYRKPKEYSFKKLNDVIEFKDDVCELLVDETCKIIASDIDSLNQKGLAQERETIDN